MKRVVIPELLDSDSGSAEEVHASLADLDFVNRHFGGHSATGRLLREVAEKCGLPELSLLDVGGGTGEFVDATKKRLVLEGIALHCTVLDRVHRRLADGSNGSRFVTADASQLPFAAGSFDVVSSNLFCHHLEPEEFIRFINEGLRVARVAVLINDLRRNYFHLLAVYGGFLFYRSRLTRHDAPASVRRAYTGPEMRTMIQRTRASGVSVHRFHFQRMGIIVWR
jgi:ubiquinone/menaquinone biosynthesis C-methylase UbiE